MKKRIAALLTAMAMVLLLAMPTMADPTEGNDPVDGGGSNYTPVVGGELTVYKDLLLDADAEVPNAKWDFEVTYPDTSDPNGLYISATADTLPVYVGPQTVQVKTTTETNYANNTNELSFSPEDTWEDVDEDHKAVTKEVTLSFEGVSFTEPGVYRYWLQEKKDVANPAAIEDDVEVTGAGNTWRTIDVYVEDNSIDPDKSLVVKTYIVYEGKLTDTDEVPADISVTYNYATIQGMEWHDATDPEHITYTYLTGKWYKQDTTSGAPVSEEITEPPADAFHEAGGLNTEGEITTYADRKAEVEAAQYAAQEGKTPNSAEAGTKNDRYVNAYATFNLEFEKLVKGNQGSKDQYFEFNLTLSNIAEGTVLNIDTDGFDTALTGDDGDTPNAATTFTIGAINAANGRDDDDGDPTDGQQLIAPESGTITWKVYLQHGQKVVIKGLPSGAEYELTEAEAAGYTTTEGTEDVAVPAVEAHYREATAEEIAAGTGVVEANGTDTYKDAAGAIIDAGTKVIQVPAKNAKLYDDPTSGTIHTNTYTGFTNTREGVIPTGVKIGILGGAVLVGLAALYFVLRRRTSYEED